MAGLTGSNVNPSWKLISGYLNGENNPALGSPIASSGYAGGLVSSYGGFLGTKGVFDADDAAKLSNTTLGTLYGGTYMMVRVSATATQSQLVRGRLVFWDLTAAEDLYQVTNDETQNGGQPLFAGILLNAVTAGNYCVIQVAGRATVQMRATVTAATRNITWAAAGAGVDNATADAQASATAVTFAFMNNYLGLGEAVAANGALIIVDLKPFITRQ
jgi:hypothetical protein